MPLSMQNKTRIAFGLVGLMVFATIYVAQGKPGTLQFTVNGETAYVSGVTKQRSYYEMKRFLNDNPEVQRLVLKDMPGTHDSLTNLSIARMIRNRGLATHLERDSYIASGAVDLFISGAERTMECGAFIGVHSWSFNGEIGPNDMGKDYHQSLHETFLRDMGVDPRFYVFTREAAEPEEIYYMKYSEIERFGLLTQDAGCSNEP